MTAFSSSSSVPISSHVRPFQFPLPTRIPSPSTFRTPSLRTRPPFPACAASTSPSDSWIAVGNAEDGFGGWLLGRPEEGSSSRIDAPKLLLAWVGGSVVLLLVSLAHFSLANKGFRFQIFAPFQPLCEIFTRSLPAKTLKREVKIEPAETIIEDQLVLPQQGSDQRKDDPKSGKKGYKMVPVAADSTQQQSLSLLQELKIIEADAKPYELCTRREYARWLVKANSLLERDPKHRIVPSKLIAGSTTTAFDDVNSQDPDFLFIQAIGESGVVPSRLSAIDLHEVNDKSDTMDKYVFSPESLISRLDLISWKAKLEYPLAPKTDKKMLKRNIGFTDVGTVSTDVLQELFMDTLAGDRSILRRVFGNIRRLQPHKPVTKAQVAVALTSGRMVDAIRMEISRIESERISNLVTSKEIMSELIHKGDIREFWEIKIREEKKRGLEVQKELIILTENLAEEKVVYEKEMNDHIKEKAALDCQWQLLSSLREEVDRMSERVVNEKYTVATEQSSLKELLVKLYEDQNAAFEAKSILEVEKEALKILRSWVEDGARRSQFRAKVLEDAVQRWKWDGQSGLSNTT